MVKYWLSLINFDPSSWSYFKDIEVRWTTIAFAHGGRSKSIASLVMLVTWELWKERNAWTFNNKSTLPSTIFDIIKLEARTWAFKKNTPDRTDRPLISQVELILFACGVNAICMAENFLFMSFYLHGWTYACVCLSREICWRNILCGLVKSLR
jgi:hypothetical protein